MLLITKFARFLLKITLLSTIGWWIATRAFPDYIHPTILRWIWPVALVSSFVLLSFDNVFIYPFYRNPLRHFTTVKERGAFEMQIITETPRGKTPLRWIHEHPEASVLHLRGSFNESRLFPVSPEALRDVMSTHTYDFEKPWGVRAFLARVIGFGLILSEGAAHKKQRKVLTPAFNIKRIRELYGLMWQKTNILLEEIEKDLNAHLVTPANEKGGAVGVVELSEWASRLTLDIIGPTAMGRDFKSLTTEENPVAQAFLEILEPSPEMIRFFGGNFFFPQWIMRRLPVKTNRVIKRSCGFLRDLCHDIVREKQQAMLKEKSPAAASYDILSGIMETGEFTNDEIVDQMLTFLAAGHETTASALTWCCYLLANNPHIQAALRAEIHATISSSSDAVTSATLEGMPYLNGVCEETLRLFPTVPTTIREAVRDTQMAGQRVPKNTLVVIVPYAVNRSPQNWGPDAEEMVPERWIDTAPDGTKRPNKHGGASSNFCEITFLHGQRACIGRDFAKAELRCAVAGVVGKFRMEMEKPDEQIQIAGVVTTKPVQGMKLKMQAIQEW